MGYRSLRRNKDAVDIMYQILRDHGSSNVQREGVLKCDEILSGVVRNLTVIENNEDRHIVSQHDSFLLPN